MNLNIFVLRSSSILPEPEIVMVHGAIGVYLLGRAADEDELNLIWMMFKD